MMHLKQTSKVEEAALDYIERPWLQDQDFEHIDQVHPAVADLDENGNRAPEVEQGVQLNGSLGFAKLGVSEQTQKQVDGGGV